MFQKHTLWLFLLPMTFTLLSCSGAEDPRLAELRDRLLLPEEPADSRSISATKDRLPENSDVVLIGQVADSELSEVDRNKAYFLLSELPLPGHEASKGHDAESCPFCRRKAEQAPRAAVQFVDEQGQILPYDVAELFRIQAGDVVIVRGQGEAIPDTNLISITADRLYVRR